MVRVSQIITAYKYLLYTSALFLIDGNLYFCFLRYYSWPVVHYFTLSYQITQLVMTIIASLMDSKTLSRGFPSSPIRPMAIPRMTANTTRPSTLEPSVNSWSIDQEYKLSGIKTYNVVYLLIKKIHTVKISKLNKHSDVV